MCRGTIKSCHSPARKLAGLVYASSRFSREGVFDFRKKYAEFQKRALCTPPIMAANIAPTLTHDCDASSACQLLLAAEVIAWSVNAPMESCWGSLKTELIHHRRFATRDEAKREITKYIDMFYRSICCLQYLCKSITQNRWPLKPLGSALCNRSQSRPGMPSKLA